MWFVIFGGDVSGGPKTSASCFTSASFFRLLLRRVGLIHGSKVCLPAIARRLPTDGRHV